MRNVHLTNYSNKKILTKQVSLKQIKRLSNSAIMQPLLNWLAPKQCLNCSAQANNSDLFCSDCENSLPYYTDGCRACGQAYISLTSNLSQYCGRCIQSPKAFDSVFCPFTYDAPISLAIQQLKYAEQPKLAQSLARLLANQIMSLDMQLPECLIPVPMHKQRLEERGYNQSALLCKELAQLLSLPYDLFSVSKIKNTEPLASLGFKARQNCIRGAFKLKPNKTLNKTKVKTNKAHLCTAQTTTPLTLPFKHIAIIDDVFTTGATTNELSRVLRRHSTGIKNTGIANTRIETIDVWAIAHTL